MRRLPFYPMLIAILVSFGTYLGCDPKQVEQGIDSAIARAEQSGAFPNAFPGAPSGIPVSTSNTRPGMLPNAPMTSAPMPGTQQSAAQTGGMRSSTVPARTGNTMLIGSFNMQRLGPSKLAKPWVMERFADIIRSFDVIALQEITSKDQNTLPTLLQYVNRNGARYGFTISTQVGRAATGYFEQYAYVFDTTRAYTVPEACYVVQDPEDMLHREPFVGRFRTTVTAGPPFSFTLVNIHTDPGEISTELNVLATVLVNVAQFEYPEDDVMLLGDLNADPAKLLNLGKVPDIYPTIQGIPTNTRKSKTLDNILISSRQTTEYTGRSGILDLVSTFSITQADAEEISDHQPIWAEFSVFERSGNQIATQPGGGFVR